MSLEIVAEVSVEIPTSQQRGHRTESERVTAGATNCSAIKANLLCMNNRLLEQVVDEQNLMLAKKKVCANKGAPGIDGRSVEDLHGFLTKQWPRIKEEIFKGTYQPNPVKRVEIPKSQGGTRPLGIPTVADRFIQQAIAQILSPLFESEFSQQSFGFRPGRSAHQAIRSAKKFQQEGKRFVVDMDLKSFFDEVNHDILMSLLAKKIKDKPLLMLIRSYLQAGVMVGGVVQMPVKGTPQGSPLSPLLSNIILNELDKELERRGHSFCRYADDCNIYVKTKRSGERVLKSIASFLDKKLKLKINWDKSAVDRPWNRQFLGFSFSMHKDTKIRIAPKARKRFKTRVKELCRSGKGMNLQEFIIRKLNPYLKGWVNYFKLAEETKKFMKEADEWIRHRLRNILWRQWKRNWTRFCNLRKLGIGEERARMSAFNKRGPWYNSGASHMNQAMKLKHFEKAGLFSLFDHCYKCQ